MKFFLVKKYAKVFLRWGVEMNHIVFTDSENLNEEPFTTSEVVAEYAELKHHAVQQLINMH